MSDRFHVRLVDTASANESYLIVVLPYKRKPAAKTVHSSFVNLFFPDACHKDSHIIPDLSAGKQGHPFQNFFRHLIWI